MLLYFGRSLPFSWLFISAACLMCLSSLSAQDERKQVDGQDQMEVLLRGPVHEAFADPIVFEPKAGPAMDKEPPEDLNEVPPSQRPAGEHVVWMSGYWSWDDERNDFIWVSGIWRNIPPGREWMAGYWQKDNQQWRWISGYWSDASAAEIAYLPAPPPSQEAGPNVPSPGPDYLWSPGIWMWQQNSYAWQPGVWYQGSPNWIWNPGSYRYSPQGYIYNRGYWDYPLSNRGLLFAPVFGSRNIYQRPGFFYTPQTFIRPGLLTNSLFIRPNYRSYYFGDYFGNNYATNGYYPWYQYQNSRFGYDPLYATNRWLGARTNPRWDQQMQALYQRQRDQADQRPPRTLAEQAKLTARPDAGGDGVHRLIGASLNAESKEIAQGLALKEVSREDASTMSKLRDDMRDAARERRTREQSQAAADSGNAKSKVNVQKFKPSPIRAQLTSQSASGNVNTKNAATRDKEVENRKTPGSALNAGREPRPNASPESKTGGPTSKGPSVERPATPATPRNPLPRENTTPPRVNPSPSRVNDAPPRANLTPPRIQSPPPARPGPGSSGPGSAGPSSPGRGRGAPARSGGGGGAGQGKSR